MSHVGLKFIVPEVAGSNTAQKVTFVVRSANLALQVANLFLATTATGVGIGAGGGAIVASSVGFAALIITGPLATFAGTFIGMGAGYAAGRKIAAERALARGYSRGVVMAIHGRKAHTVIEYFGHERFFNTFDEDSAILARNAYLSGLVAGFIEGTKLSKNQKHILLKDLEARSGLRWGQLQHDSERAAMFWYVELAGTFHKAHIVG